MHREGCTTWAGYLLSIADDHSEGTAGLWAPELSPEHFASTDAEAGEFTHGPLPGKLQTINRSELWSAIVTCRPHRAADLFSDSQYVVDGFNLHIFSRLS